MAVLGLCMFDVDTIYGFLGVVAMACVGFEYRRAISLFPVLTPIIMSTLLAKPLLDDGAGYWFLWPVAGVACAYFTFQLFRQAIDQAYRVGLLYGMQAAIMEQQEEEEKDGEV